MRGRGKGRELSCKLQNNAKIKPQIKWVRIYISLPEEKITLGKWKGTVDTKKLKLLSGKICRLVADTWWLQGGNKRIHGGRNILPGEYVVDIIHIASLMVFEKGAATLPY